MATSGGWNGGYGTYIVIKHENGTQTLYAHNSSNTVSVGDEVEQGDVIGYVGQTGKATGPHLHFEVRGAKNPF
jgi:murein DD-endopeptidase MepM/ murein hydrolase activator NlpD